MVTLDGKRRCAAACKLQRVPRCAAGLCVCLLLAPSEEEKLRKTAAVGSERVLQKGLVSCRRSQTSLLAAVARRRCSDEH